MIRLVNNVSIFNFFKKNDLGQQQPTNGVTSKLAIWFNYF